MKAQISVRGRSTTNYIDRWIGASVLVLSFFMGACATGPSREPTNALLPPSSLSQLSFQPSMQAGFSDTNGNHVAGTELVHLMPYRGRLYAGNSLWLEEEPKVPKACLGSDLTLVVTSSQATGAAGDTIAPQGLRMTGQTQPEEPWAGYVGSGLSSLTEGLDMGMFSVLANMLGSLGHWSGSKESSGKEKNYMRMTQNITDQATDLAAKAKKSFPGMSDDDLAKKLEDQGFSIRWNPPTYDENGNVTSRATIKGVYVPGTPVLPLVGRDPSQTSNMAEAQAIASDWMKDYQAGRMTPQLAQQYRDREWKLYGYGFIPGGSVYDAGITISGIPIPAHTANWSGSEVPPYLAALPSDIDPYFEKTAREWAKVSLQYSISYPGYAGTSEGWGTPSTPDSYYQSILAGLRTGKIPKGGYLTAVSPQQQGGISGYILREPTIHEIGAH